MYSVFVWEPLIAGIRVRLPPEGVKCWCIWLIPQSFPPKCKFLIITVERNTYLLTDKPWQSGHYMENTYCILKCLYAADTISKYWYTVWKTHKKDFIVESRHNSGTWQGYIGPESKHKKRYKATKSGWVRRTFVPGDQARGTGSRDGFKVTVWRLNWQH